MTTVRERLAEGYRRSTARRLGDGLARSMKPVRAAYPDSRLAGGLARTGTVVRRSWLYRWLTAEPDPEVIVVDLRRTYTVGPLLGLLERALAPFERAAHSSASVRTLDRVASNPVPVVGAVLLGAALASFAVSWPAIDPAGLVAHGLVAGAGGLGVAADDSATALANSRATALVATLLKPPEPAD